MFEYIKGKLTEASLLKVTVEANGIGYGLLIPLSNYAKLPSLGQEILLYCSLVIREDSHRLFGFLTQREKELFGTLTEVSGIGPKTALALIGHMDISDLQAAISRSDIALLSKIPGIGKKTAERLIVELRDKVKNFTELSTTSSDSGASGRPRLVSDAVSALINLGYNPMHADKAVKNALTHAADEPDLATLITSALRHF